MSFTLVGFTLLFLFLVIREVRSSSDIPFLLRLWLGASIIATAAILGPRRSPEVVH